MTLVNRANAYLSKVYAPRKVTAQGQSFHVGGNRVAYLSDPKFTSNRVAIVNCCGDDDRIMTYLD